MAKILILDDDYAIRSLFQYLFQEAGYQAKTAKNGEDALAMLSEFIPDVMLVDISMPVMSGPEFISRLRQLSIERPELRNIPFIVLTGENFMRQDMQHLFGNDPCCRYFLPKMTPSDNVLEMVAKIVPGSREPGAENDGRPIARGGGPS